MALGRIEPVSHALQGAIEIWRTDLDQYPFDPEAAIFSADERSRAERFLLDDDRRRFLAAHHALRHVLGLALDRQPSALAFQTSDLGKPRLLDGRGLEFSLSHSFQQCLIGISADRPIGVDVEVAQRVVATDALARRHFTRTEIEQWERTPAPDRARVFLQGWTRKEACLKALGSGLSEPPGSIEAGCDEGARIVVAELGSRRVQIELVSINLADVAIGAVALADPAA
jgi:4'-phosphopantetheinyl transferase